MEDKSLSLWKIPLGVSKPNKYNAKEMKMGMRIEKEHGGDLKVTKKIVTDHLDEHPKYYTKLKKVFKH